MKAWGKRGWGGDSKYFKYTEMRSSDSVAATNVDQ